MEPKMRRAARMAVVCACAGALALGAALPAFAAGTTDPVSGPTKVSYDTSTVIDSGLSWVVRIPSSLSFDRDSAKTGIPVKVTVASKTTTPLRDLADFPGYAAPVAPGTDPTYGKVDVYISSKNACELKLSDGTDPLRYTLTSPDGGHSWTDGSGIKTPGDGSLGTQIFCSLAQNGATDPKATETSKTGTAVLNSTPTKDGDHTDVLTFGFYAKGTI